LEGFLSVLVELSMKSDSRRSRDSLGAAAILLGFFNQLQ